MVLLTSNEYQGIQGNNDSISKVYQRKLKHDIKKKITTILSNRTAIIDRKSRIGLRNEAFF